jgi:hypothetical protein
VLIDREHTDNLKDDEALVGLVVGLGVLALAAVAALAFLLFRQPLCAHCNTRHRPGPKYCSAQQQQQQQSGGYVPRTRTGDPIDLPEN